MKHKNVKIMMILNVLLMHYMQASQKSLLTRTTDKTMTFLDNKSMQRMATLASLGVASYYGVQCVQEVRRLMHNRLSKGPKILSAKEQANESDDRLLRQIEQNADMLSQRIRQANAHIAQVDARLLDKIEQTNSNLAQLSEKVDQANAHRAQGYTSLSDKIAHADDIASQAYLGKEINLVKIDKLVKDSKTAIEALKIHRVLLDGLKAHQGGDVEKMNALQARLEEQSRQIDMIYCHMSNMASNKDAKDENEEKELERKEPESRATTTDNINPAEIACAAAAVLPAEEIFAAAAVLPTETACAAAAACPK